MAELAGYGQLQRRLRALHGVAVPRTLGLAVVREAKILVPRKTGNLGRSIRLASVTERSALVVASANYAADVEFGTQPHEITPNAKKALRFAASASGRRLSGAPRKGADVVFAKRVHHPGTKAHPFLLPAAKKAVAASDLPDTIVTLWNGAA